MALDEGCGTGPADEVDVVLPCLDEAEALPWLLSRMPPWARPIVVDNGSTDGSARIARDHGALVVPAGRRGYGAACHAGLQAAGSEVVAFMDADASLDPADLALLLRRRSEGPHLLLGRRVAVGQGAWPWHLRLANRAVTWLLRRRTGLSLNDIGPMRMAPRAALLGAADPRPALRVPAGDGPAGGPGRLAGDRGGHAVPPPRGPVQGHRHAARGGPDGARHDPGPPLVTDRTGTVVVLAKSPVAHRVKTRLTPAFSAREAAALAQAAIRDTLDVVTSGPSRAVVAWDGPHRTWLPAPATVVSQRGDGLDERLTNVFADVFGDGTDEPTLLVGMDTPQLTAAHLDVDWSGVDAVLGLSEDGGFWAVGLRRHHPEAFLGVPMSTPATGAAQLARLRRLGLRVGALPRLRDVDTPEDAAAVAALAPDTRFARLHRRLVAGPCPPTVLFDAALSGSRVHVTEADAGAGAGAWRRAGCWTSGGGSRWTQPTRCWPPGARARCWTSAAAPAGSWSSWRPPGAPPWGSTSRRSPWPRPRRAEPRC